MVRIDAAGAIDGAARSLGKAEKRADKFKTAIAKAEEQLLKMQKQEYICKIKIIEETEPVLESMKQKISALEGNFKINISWSEMVERPFMSWWSGRGKAWIDDAAQNMGTIMGTAITAGLTATLMPEIMNCVNTIAGALGSGGDLFWTKASVYATAASVFATSANTIAAAIPSLAQAPGLLIALGGLANLAGVAASAYTYKSGSKDYLTAEKLTDYSDLNMKEAYESSGEIKKKWSKIGTVIGFILGSITGNPVGGALVGGGVGSAVGMWKGEKIKKEAEIVEVQGKYSSQELKDALANGMSEESDEFQQRLREVNRKRMEKSFGNISLTLKEIKRLSKEIVFGDKVKDVERFRMAVSETEQNMANFENSVAGFERLKWKIEVGMTLSPEENKTFQNQAKQIGEDALATLESRHYKADMAVQMLLGVEGSKEIRGVFKDIYGQNEEAIINKEAEIDKYIGEHSNKGVFDTKYSEGLNQLMQEMMELVSNSETESATGVMKATGAKYRQKHMDIKSFEALEEELKEDVGSYEKELGEALADGLNGLEKTKDSNPYYKQQQQELIAAYNAQMDTLYEGVSTNLLEKLVESYSDIFGNVTAEDIGLKLKEARDSGIDLKSLSADEMLNYFDLEGIGDKDNKALIANVLQQIIEVLPNYGYGVSPDGTVDYNFSVDEESLAAKAQENKSMVEAAMLSVAEGAIPVEFLIEPSIRPTGKPIKLKELLTGMGGKTDSESGTKQETVQNWQLVGNANGGFITSPLLSWVGEDGPEAIIPLGSKRRSRGLSLWKQTGELLGIPAFADGVITNDGGLFSDTGLPAYLYGSSDTGFTDNSGEETGQPAVSVPVEQKTSSVQVAVSAAPVININGVRKDDDIVSTIRSHIRELADDMCGEIADKITVVFSNMPKEA
ncbi:glycine zipper domain-containing protein [Clostridium sp. AM58-1XD]|uniref:glycine zipper domain-containing protein n=1 Tax=Clostridium sp. AM58-1XD TaxID=2292307 RepID=UPI0015F6875E|nr:glycine zipper domain-containing protein [Clostridium sp. AM58-1XD]